MLDMHLPIPVLSQFRHFQCNHEASYPGPRSSDVMALNFSGTDRRWWVHALSCSAGGGVTEAISRLHAFVYVLVTE